MVERVGVHLWNVSSNDLELDVKQLGEDMATDTLLTTLRPYFSALSKILARHINESIAAGDWDVVIGNDFLQTLVSCMHSA